MRQRNSEGGREGELISGLCFVPQSTKGPYLHLFIRNIIIDSGLRPLILAGSCISRKYKGWLWWCDSDTYAAYSAFLSTHLILAAAFNRGQKVSDSSQARQHCATDVFRAYRQGRMGFSQYRKQVIHRLHSVREKTEDPGWQATNPSCWSWQSHSSKLARIMQTPQTSLVPAQRFKGMGTLSFYGMRAEPRPWSKRASSFWLVPSTASPALSLLL